MADGLKPLKHPLTEPRKQAEPCEETEPAYTSDLDGSSWTSAFALTILAANCGAAIYRSRHDPWSVAFVSASLAVLLLLFYALRLFERLPRGSPRRAHVKAAVWVLSTVLTVMFSHRVAALMPFPVAVVVWAMACSTILAGFYMFFVCRDGPEVAAEEKPAKVVDFV